MDSQTVTVRGSSIHYIKAGKGDPILFLHGMPTSSYLWRKIIPAMSQYGCCIAPDLIGMGQSDKPEIEYTVFDHIAYIEDFIVALGLKNITLVMHGWGSVIGFSIAARHPKWFKAMAFYEAHVRAAVNFDMLSLPVQQLATLLSHDKASYTAIVDHDYLVEKLLPRGTLSDLDDEVMDHYRAPFIDKSSRQPLWQYVHDLPLGTGDTKVTKCIDKYSAWLQKSTMPKLMMYAVPGFITPMDTVMWAKQHIAAMTLVDLGEAMHFAQESIPDQFATALVEWYSALV